jgi:uncharacterized protein (TIGR02145 family)
VALNGSEITVTTFVANWSAAGGATGYYLDVATDALFTSMVAGYNNKDVGNVLVYSIIGLGAFTNYYYRVRGYNEVGTGDNSNVETIKTLNGIADVDGNIYNIITIGTQQWLIENLKTTKYADGSAIPNITNDAAWGSDVTGAYCWYDDDIANKTLYGALYNWYAVNNAHGLAPTGWRIPSDVDFVTLETFLGGSIIAGGKLKEMGLTHWTTPNTGATNDYGFKGMPSGRRLYTGEYQSIGTNCFLHTTKEDSPTHSVQRYLSHTSAVLSLSTVGKNYGLAIRCMRDTP